MIRLDSPLRKLEILLGGAVATSQPAFVASWSDASSSGYVGGATPGVTNNTVAVTLVAAPSSGVIRDVDYISVKNLDSASAVATIQYNDNGTTFVIIKVTLNSMDSIIYTHAGGWMTLDSTGALHTTGSMGPTGSSGPVGPPVYLEAEAGEDALIMVPGNPGTPGATGLTGPAGPAVYFEVEPEEALVVPVPGPAGASGATGSQGPQGPAIILDPLDVNEEQLFVFGGTASSSSSSSTALNNVQNFRLTLTTGVPVTVSDVTGATTLYCTPYKGNQISLFDGTNWNIRTSNEFSLALGTLTNAKPYDVFCFDNSGTPTLEILVWTNDTTRATGLVYQNGILVKSGASTRRYLGTFYSTSTTTTEDSAVKRFLWNYYHRIGKSLLRRETTASWTYTTATVRQANANTANQVEFVRGLEEDAVLVHLNSIMGNGGAPDIAMGMGLDSTSSINIGQSAGGNFSNQTIQKTGHYTGFPGLGRHFIAWLESSSATGTTTWYGNISSAGATLYSGLSGISFC